MRNGHPGMMVEGEPITRQDGNYPMHTKEFLEAAARGMEKHEAARAAGFDPKSRLHDMDEHGVDAQAIYPTVGGQMLGKPFHDTELLAAVCRAYNDWSLEYCSHAPERLRMAAMLLVQAPDLAVEEAQRAAEAGLRASTSVPTPSRTATCTTRATRRCGAPWRNWACRCASTTRACRTCRRSATGWRPTPRDTSSPTRSRRWWR